MKVKEIHEGCVMFMTPQISFLINGAQLAVALYRVKERCTQQTVRPSDTVNKETINCVHAILTDHRLVKITGLKLE